MPSSSEYYYWIKYSNSSYQWCVRKEYANPDDYIFELWKSSEDNPEGTRIWPPEYDNIPVTKRDRKIIDICRIWVENAQGVDFETYFDRVLPAADVQNLYPNGA